MAGLAAARRRPPADWTPDVAAARDYAAPRPGSIAFAVRTETRFWRREPDRVFPSASVLKAMLLVAYLRHAAATGRCAPTERALLAADDPPLRQPRGDSTIFDPRRHARAPPPRPRRAHDPLHAREPDLGQLADHRPATRPASSCTSTRCCRPATAPTRMLLLAQVVAAPALGHRRARDRPTGRVYFKGGWGSGTGAVDHQIAPLTRDDQRIAIAVLTEYNGSHAVGKADARRRLSPCS